MDDIILSGNSNLEKLTRFVVDSLEKEDNIGIRASVEQAINLDRFIESLCRVFSLTVSEKKTAHIKSCGKHIKVVRYIVSSNNLEFHDELKRIT